jgi:hypothetical protein
LHLCHHASPSAFRKVWNSSESAAAAAAAAAAVDAVGFLGLHDRFIRYNNELIEIPHLLTNLPRSMRFDVLSRMAKSLGCFDVRMHPLFVNLSPGTIISSFL